MIPFASQRANGQDLATHLQNAQDNDYLEVANLRGAVADDLHGAFAEWEVQAHALTKCRNYLYSLSINPDPAQGPLARSQYMDYIDRTERSLGLGGQPRAVVFHIKNGREHCHVVWSRIDAERRKAVQLSFDRDKLMMVTRQFAREHGLSLPKGYEREGTRGRQATQYEMAQRRATALTKDQRIEAVTEAWRQSDTPKAFVAALSDQGYILATGNKPYVLVDLYGYMNTVPKLIGDKQVRTQDIRAFLERDYPVHELPTVEDAKAMAADHRQQLKAFRETEDRAEQVERLKERQTVRRREAEAACNAVLTRQKTERQALAGRHAAQRRSLKTAYLAKGRRIRRERQAKRPTGLAAFLGRMSGVELVRRKVHRFQDRQRLERYRADRDRLKDRQRQETAELSCAHRMQGLDAASKLRNLGKLDTRERRALEETFVRERNERARSGRAQMPALNLALKPPGRQPKLIRAAGRHRHGADTRQRVDAASPPADPIELTPTFDRAAEGGPRRKERSDGESRAQSRKGAQQSREGRNKDRSGRDR